MKYELTINSVEYRLSEIRQAIWEIEVALRYGDASAPESLEEAKAVAQAGRRQISVNKPASGDLAEAKPAESTRRT